MVKAKRKRNKVEKVIKGLGGLRATSRYFGRAPSAVHRWRVLGKFPKTIKKTFEYVTLSYGI